MKISRLERFVLAVPSIFFVPCAAASGSLLKRCGDVPLEFHFLRGLELLDMKLHFTVSSKSRMCSSLMGIDRLAITVPPSSLLVSLEIVSSKKARQKHYRKKWLQCIRPDKIPRELQGASRWNETCEKVLRNTTLSRTRAALLTKKSEDTKCPICDTSFADMKHLI